MNQAILLVKVDKWFPCGRERLLSALREIIEKRNIKKKCIEMERQLTYIIGNLHLGLLHLSVSFLNKSN